MLVIKKIAPYKKILVLIIGVFFLITLVYALFNIFLWSSDSIKTKEQIAAINKSGIDFDKLKKDNTDVRGWLKVPGTNIDYPFLQTTNNKFYLNHSFDKSVNQAGWLFMDYRNDINSFNQNTIIYAHARVDGTMFGSMKNTLEQDWYSNKDNHIIKIYSEKQKTNWRVFSVYRIKTTDDYLNTSFSDDTEFELFLDLINKRSKYNFKTFADKNDKLLTLSTCYNDTERVVLHAKLVSVD